MPARSGYSDRVRERRWRIALGSSEEKSALNVLGISCFYHDAAACLVQDGRIVAAASEERFTRKKHDADFPTQADVSPRHALLLQGDPRLVEREVVDSQDHPA